MDKVKRFYLSNKSLSNITVCAVIVVIVYQLSMDLPELWNHAHQHFELIYQLALAVIANFIFSVYQVYIPNNNRKHRVQKYIITRLRRIQEKMIGQIQSLCETYLREKKSIDSITDEDLLEIINNFRGRDESNIQLARECRQLNNMEMLELYFYEIDEVISELEASYGEFLSDECNILLKDISNSAFRQTFKKVVQLSMLFDTKGIKGDATLDCFKKYIDLIRRINNIQSNI